MTGRVAHSLGRERRAEPDFAVGRGIEAGTDTAGPWTLLVTAGVALLMLALFGLDGTVDVAVIATEAVFIIFFLRHFGFAVSALETAPNDLEASPVRDPGFWPAVSVLVACKNEESVVENLATSLLRLDYPAELLQLIVIDDQSSDRTPELVDQLAARESQLVCVHRKPGGRSGKSAALNEALPLATGEIIVVFDADHQPRPDTLRRLVSHFRDPRVGAAQGRCEIRNPGDSPLARLVAMDYWAGYFVNEYSRQSLFALPAYGGANCAVRASSLRAIGGWNADSVTEDTDLSVRLALRGERIRYDVNAVDREEAVVSIGRFWRQRYRWARGHQEVCRRYRLPILRSRHLSWWQKLETVMFLYVFHLPVVSGLGLVIVAAWSAGLVHVWSQLELSVFWTLLFLGPLLELGTGLLVARASRRDAWALAFFLPLFFVSVALCSKAWIDGVLGRRYQWDKTRRADDRTTAAPS